MNINLVDLMNSKLAEMKFPLGNKEKIITYFLERNIKAIFGQVNFTDEEIDINTIANKKSGLVVEITLNNLTYILSSDENQINFKNNQDVSSFTISVFDDCIGNVVTSKNDKLTKNEIMKVNLGTKNYFAYQKECFNNDGEEIISKINRVYPIGLKYGANDLFKLESEDLKTHKKKTKSVCIETSKSVIDLNDYLREIFAKLETVSDKSSYIRKRI